MDTFNPKILDASIRDVAECLSDNQKADLVLYGLRNLKYKRQYKTLIENAIQACLQVHTLSPETVARARILRARARIDAGSVLGAQDDLQAALIAEPDNTEATALLHQRSLLSPQPTVLSRSHKFSPEVWREIALFLPRRDLQTLLFVPHVLSRVASQLLFRELHLHFSSSDPEDGIAEGGSEKERDVRRSADILTRVITDNSFACVVKTLRIYALKPDKDGSIAFQTAGMLANALPKMINLRKVHISSGPEGVMPVLKIVQASSPRLNALSLHIPDGFDIGNLEFHRIGHFAYRANGEHPISFLNAHRNTLRTIHLENPGWSFPSECLSIRNLTHIHFLGQFPPNSRTIEEIFTNGHQLECLSLNCLLDCMPSAQFRSLVSTPVLPFLRDFTFSISGMARRVVDRDLFPAIAEFLRDRKELRTLGLMVPAGEAVQRQVGFDASLWGVLPSLTGLKGLCITYPRDLAPGLASWLIPRSVRCLTLDGIGVTGSQRDLKSFLQNIRTGIPPMLRFIGMSEFPLGMVSMIIEDGFPMVRLMKVGPQYWTLEPWPKRRATYHAAEWLEWFGCEEAQPTEFC
ncbi:hypothetical protein CPB85DRAFT_1221723 [Mucidula mucida]|nr:hypothetical protein CPB85DRAFT_1221723 [Mucidula mucida]